MIIWGTTHLRSKQGRVADFCPMCRQPRAFMVIRTNAVGHVYFIPLGTGRTIAVSAVCESCGHEIQRDPTLYRTLAGRRSKDDVTALIRQTFPNLAEVYAERLELEAQLAKSVESIGANVREELIREALVNISGAVEQLYGKTNLDWRFGTSLIAAIVGPMLLGMLAAFVGDAWQEWVSVAVLMCIGGGLAASVYFAATVNGRRMRATLLPRLITALRPLRPRESELEALLARFKASGLKIGKKLRAREIAAAVDPQLVKSLGR